MLSLTCKTAIRAVIFIASREITGIIETAENIGASTHTVGKILQSLVKEDIIKSIKGPGGGFYITKDQLRKPVIDIIEVIDGQDVLKQCALGLSECSAINPCPFHAEYKHIKQAFLTLCRTKKIRELGQSVTAGESCLVI